MALTYQQLLEKVKKEIKTASPEALQKDLDSQAEVTIIDIREHDEFIQGHLPSALFIPRGFLELRIENTIPDRNQKIYLCCGGGNRSILAARSLQELGYQNVYGIEGGFHQWTRENRPVTNPHESDDL